MPPSEQDNLLSICRNLNGTLNGFAQQISCKASYTLLFTLLYISGIAAAIRITPIKAGAAWPSDT